MKKFIIIIALFCMSCANNKDKVDLLEFKMIELKASDNSLKYEIKKLEHKIERLRNEIKKIENEIEGLRYDKEYQKDFQKK